MRNCYVRLMGGLGNQLFQVAAGYAYAKKYNMNFYIDSTTWSGGQGKNGFLYKDTLFKNFSFKTSDTVNTFIHTEPDFSYSEIPDYDVEVILLNGYFQSFKYFEDVWNDLEKQLDLPILTCLPLGIKNVAFHIRRGDYLGYKDIYYNCDTSYFDKCFKLFKGYQIHVFTDSPEHVLQEFEHQDFKLIQTPSEIMDLTLMSYHDNIVGSNSTFSWWGSLLNGKKQKIIMPSKWFVNGKNESDIYRKDFTKFYA